MGKTKQCSLRQKAAEDLEGIYQHSLAQWGPAKAQEYLRAIITQFDTLTENPGLGRNLGFVKVGVKAFRCQSHSIFYRATVSGIVIIRVLHVAMDLHRHL